MAAQLSVVRAAQAQATEDDPHAPLAIDLSHLPLPAFGQHAAPPAPAEAATHFGFENDRAPQRTLPWLRHPIASLRIWRLRWLLDLLKAQHQGVTHRLASNVNDVIEMSRRNQVCPWWPEARRDLQSRQDTLADRIADVASELVKLERSL